MADVTDEKAGNLNKETKQNNDVTLGDQIARVKGTVTLAGTPETVTNANVLATDIVQVTVKTQDTGSNVTAIVATAAAGSFDIAYAGGSGNDGVAQYVVFRA